jgi:hypothetical protein
MIAKTERMSRRILATNIVTVVIDFATVLDGLHGRCENATYLEALEAAVEVVVHRELNRIKGGWSAHVEELGLSAHGASPEIADLNLERTIRLFLAPFARAGTLRDELLGFGIQHDGIAEGMTIRLDGIKVLPTPSGALQA